MHHTSWMSLVALLAVALVAGCTGPIPSLPDDVTCTNAPTVPLTASERVNATGLLRFRFDVPNKPADVRLCVIDASFRERHEVTRTLPGGQVTTIDIALPPGVYYAFQEQGDWKEHNGYTSTSQAFDLRECRSGAYQTSSRYEITDTRTHVSSARGDHGCFRPSQDQHMDSGALGFAERTLPPGIMTVALGLGALAGLAYSVRARLTWITLGLFTRLVKPTILDQAARAQIYEAIERDPGVQPSELRDRLGFANSHIAYHLQVLRRERIVTMVGTPGMRHYFVTGRFPPDEMRQRAVLRRPTVGRIFRHVAGRPSATLQGIATDVGCSLGLASRHLRRLIDVGLVTTERNGRRLAFRATRTLHGPISPR